MINKKAAFLSVLLSALLLLSSCNVHLTNPNFTDDSNNIVSVSLNESFELTDGIEMKLVQVRISEMVYDCTTGSGFVVSNDGDKFVDCIFEVTNSTQQEFDCKKSIDAYTSMVNDDYCFGNLVMLSESGEYWKDNRERDDVIIPASATRRVHFYDSYSSDLLVSDYEYILFYNDGTNSIENENKDYFLMDEIVTDSTIFSYAVSPSKGSIGEMAELTVGQKLEFPESVNVTLEQVTKQTIIKPKNPSSRAYYFNSESSFGKDITFFTFEFTVENLMSEDIQSDEIINASVKNIDGEYKSSILITDMSNRTDVETSCRVEAGQTRTVFLVLAVDKTFDIENCEVYFGINGQPYFYRTGNGGADISYDSTSVDESSDSL